MSAILKSAVLGLGLIAGVATAAPAQTVSGATPGTSIASLPQPGPRASSYNSIPDPARQAIAPSGTYAGPKAGDGWYPSTEKQTQAVIPSPQYVGPKPN